MKFYRIGDHIIDIFCLKHIWVNDVRLFLTLHNMKDGEFVIWFKNKEEAYSEYEKLSNYLLKEEI